MCNHAFANTSKYITLKNNKKLKESYLHCYATVPIGAPVGADYETCIYTQISLSPNFVCT